MKSGVRRWLGMTLKLALSVALVTVLLRAVGIDDALARLTTVSPVWLAAATVMAVFQMFICAERWRSVLTAMGAPLSFRDAFVFWYIGAFFNQTLPSAVGGDAMRGFLAYKRGLSVASVLSSLVLERVVTVLALVALVAALTPWVVDGLGAVPGGSAWFQRSVWLALGAALGGTVVLLVLDRFPASMRHWRVVRGFVVLAGDARGVLLNPGPAARTLGWSVLGHINLSVVAYLLARALDVPIGLLDCLVLFPPILLAQIVPISLAGWGVREGAAVALFALAGVADHDALAVSILYGLLMAVTSLPGVVLWLVGRRQDEGALATDTA